MQLRLSFSILVKKTGAAASLHPLVGLSRFTNYYDYYEYLLVLSDAFTSKTACGV
jgi:hypothetical protein